MARRAKKLTAVTRTFQLTIRHELGLQAYVEAGEGGDGARAMAEVLGCSVSTVNRLLAVPIVAQALNDARKVAVDAARSVHMRRSLCDLAERERRLDDVGRRVADVVEELHESWTLQDWADMREKALLVRSLTNAAAEFRAYLAEMATQRGERRLTLNMAALAKLPDEVIARLINLAAEGQ